MNYQELINKSEVIGINITEDMINKLKKYHELLSLWNEKINLTAISKEEEVIEKHFYDCIIPLELLPKEGKVIDVGSGAGFPGMIFKIFNPNYEMTLLEPINKKTNFLNEVIKELDLKDIQAINERSEDYVKENREIYDVVCARAVANLNILSELCIPLVKKDGYFLAMKGIKGDEENNDAIKAIEMLGAKLDYRQEYELANSGTRINLFYKKISNTPLNYPRSYSLIKKKPLK